MPPWLVHGQLCRSMSVNVLTYELAVQPEVHFEDCLDTLKFFFPFSSYTE